MCNNSRSGPVFIKHLKSNVYVTLNAIGSLQCNLCSHWLIQIFITQVSLWIWALKLLPSTVLAALPGKGRSTLWRDRWAWPVAAGDSSSTEQTWSRSQTCTTLDGRYRSWTGESCRCSPAKVYMKKLWASCLNIFHFVKYS